MTRHARTPLAPAPPRARRIWTGVTVGLLTAALTTGAAALAGAELPWPTLSDPTGDGVAAPAPEATATPRPTPTPTPTPTPPADAVFSLVAAGDVLLHQPVLTSARADDGYDFTPLLGPVEAFVAGADLALCHLEVPVAPDGVTPSGYPVFGAPPEIARDLAATGWDGCSTASNHSVDRGWGGVVATLDALDAAGLGHVGTARSAEEAASPQWYELTREGRTLRVAHLSVTYGTNGIPLPSDAPWAVTLLDTDDVVARATEARAAGADVVLASVHCCVEYVSEATAEQQRIAAALADSGVVDLLIGHHAHVPQPIEKLAGGPRGEGMWVAHGLGNFISNQDANCCTARTDSGLLLSATFRAPADGPVSVEDVGWTTVTVDRAGGHRVHPLTAATDGTTVGSLGGDQTTARRGRVVDVVGSEAQERTEPLTPTGPRPVVVPRTP